jgi:hypothetical protein
MMHNNFAGCTAPPHSSFAQLQTQSQLRKCKDLGSLRTSLQKERRRIAEDAARGSRYQHLSRDNKDLVNGMSTELVQYEHYLKSLQDAAALNRYITLVQTFAQRKMRELYLQISEAIGCAYSGSLESFLYRLREVHLLHDQLLGYLATQSFRSWAVGTTRNTRVKHRPLFRYQFPDCDFNRPLVIRNPDLWVDNAAKMCYTLIDLFTKFKRTTVYAISNTQLLWLGRDVGVGEGALQSSAEGGTERLWLRYCAQTAQGALPPALEHNHSSHDHPDRPCCAEYNAVWFPQFHMLVQMRCTQTRCKGDLFIDWEQTANCRDVRLQQALLQRCAMLPSVQYVLYYRPTVDWDLFCPFQIQVQYSQHDGCWCPADNQEQHTETACTVVDVQAVREDYMFLLSKDSRIRPGTYAASKFVDCQLTPDSWRPTLEQLKQFYRCAVESLDMQLAQTESQTKQIRNVVDCIQENVAMHQTMIGEYVNVDTVQSMDKIRKLGNLLEDVEKMLEKEPLKMVVLDKETEKELCEVVGGVGGDEKEG